MINLATKIPYAITIGIMRGIWRICAAILRDWRLTGLFLFVIFLTLGFVHGYMR